jgi:hypothetical protein
MRNAARSLLALVAVSCLATACQAPPAAGEIPLRLPAAGRIVAVGDLHGDLEATRRALRLAGVLDEDDRWCGGETVLVQTGDQLDRGDQEQAILDLLERLGREAAAAGGAVHVLNGNHEIMNVALDLRYVTEGGYADFADAVELPADAAADTQLAGRDPAHRVRVAAFRPGGRYALLLSERNTVQMIGDNLFVHGGVLPAHLDYGLERINAEVRAWMRGEGPEPAYMHEKGSVTWDRHYSDEPDAEDCALLGRVLAALGAARMVVGHTSHEDGIAAYCDGRVWVVDTGLSSAYGGVTQALEITAEGVRILR